MPDRSETTELHRGTEAFDDAVLVGRMDAEALRHEEIDFIDVLLTLSRHRNAIVAVTLSASIFALLVSLVLPAMYTATTTILPPQQSQSSTAFLLGQIGMLGGLMTGDLGLKNPDDLFVAMLKSRTVQDGIIDQFDLRNAYGYQRYQDARKKLDSRSRIEAGDEGLISISVSDRNPQRAAELANSYVTQLRSLNQNLAVTEAAQRRLFYQQKLDAERDDLSVAELAMKQAQEKSGLIQPEAQGRAIVDAVANMRAQVAIKEVQLQAMRTYATPDNPDLVRGEQELAGLRAQLAKLERNTGETGNGNLEVPTRQLPQAELEYLRRSRDLKYHEALYEFLSKQLEAARLDEAKEAVMIQVVDKAIPPEKKSAPHRLLIVLGTAVFTFLLSCFAALVVEAWKRRQQDPRTQSRLAMLKRTLRFSSPA
jgi:tyrosine-protein kinase Etk/Wzc